MCGIVGYTGKESALELLLNSLELLEYRGYDSAGLAIYDEDSGSVQVKKCAGRVSDLRRKCSGTDLEGSCGIGHTRWATHGGVNDLNAHPHRVGRVTLVHNGIIENFLELKKEFDLDSVLQSETDTEVVAALIDHFYQGDPHKAVFDTVRLLKGTFSLVIMFDDIADTIFAIRNVSPIVAAYTDGGTMLASDVVALGAHAKQFMAIPEMTLMELHPDEIRLSDAEGYPVAANFTDIDWDTERAGKGNYPFYMEKEIMEQPRAIRDSIKNRIRDGHIDLSSDSIPEDAFDRFEHIIVVACGTAMHAGLIAKAFAQSSFGFRMNVECASEFIYSDPIIDDKTLLIAISQSGETIDTLAAMRYARKRGAAILSVVNMKGTSIALESDYVLYTEAGPEIAVASTKAYTTQVAVLMLLMGFIAKRRGRLDETGETALISNLQNVPEQMQRVLDKKNDIHKIARSILGAKDAFMIGRGMDYLILMEGALKLKEVSYMHTEAYASGELKHGTIALITEKTPVVAVVTQKKLVDKELSNIREVKSRGANVIGFVREDIPINESDFARIITLPKSDDACMVFPASAALQLLAYYVSSDRGLDVDKPRNLAKVVTVE